MNPPFKFEPVGAGAAKPEAVQQAVKVIKAGGVIVFPTGDLYGLGADAASTEAVKRIFAVKDRPFDRPILILIGEAHQLAGLVTQVPPAADKLIKRFWPGNVTIVFQAADTVSTALTAHSGKIGIRLAGHPAARALARAVDGPITGTSANLSGRAGTADPAQLAPELIQRVDYVLDAGVLAGGRGSTVVDVTCRPAKVLREGRIAAADIMRCIG